MVRVQRLCGNYRTSQLQKTPFNFSVERLDTQQSQMGQNPTGHCDKRSTLRPIRPDATVWKSSALTAALFQLLLCNFLVNNTATRFVSNDQNSEGFESEDLLTIRLPESSPALMDC